MCTAEKKKMQTQDMDKRIVPKKELLYTRQLAYGTEVLPKRLDILPAHGRTNLPGNFNHGYSFPIPPNGRLMATLRYLATGRTLKNLRFSCHIAPQTLGKIIPDNCEAIFKAMGNYCKCPTRGEEWENVAGEFEHRWNFPNCIGAVDGKHVVNMPPPGSGSYIYNYKDFHSQVILGIADANYELLYFRFGINGRVSDGDIFEASDLTELSLEKICVVDDAFPLREHIMKPFSRKVATPARRINYPVFSIVVERFGVLQKPISLIDFTKVHHIIMACCALHSFLRSKVPHQYTPLKCLDEEEFESGNVTPGPHCNESMSLSKIAYHPTNRTELVRGWFVEYFNNEGQVSLATKVY
ncbi:hypothetical protein PR048_006072 [Dryococelus australis]|uniref:DDE Tnp4 domain-containing protein n=1 Tax=Dryococelus australis TaxID=614101 RepID=A0ABQ9I9Z1_9NEOP|nr:hypothetical protein PR048_006072 [Dryococelus australis]